MRPCGGILCLGVILGIAASSLAHASIPDTFEDGSFRIIVPDGWGIDASTQPSKLANDDGSKVVFIGSTAIDSMSTYDAPGDDLKIAKASGPGFISSFGHQTLGGADFIVFDKQQLDPSHKGILYQRGYYTEANNYRITLLAQTLNGSLPQNDSEIMGLINSFTFVGTPQLPNSAASAATATTTASSPKGAAPETNVLLMLGGFVAAILTIVIVVAVVLWKQQASAKRS